MEQQTELSEIKNTLIVLKTVVCLWEWIKYDHTMTYHQDHREKKEENKHLHLISQVSHHSV